ncbi:MAG: AI-2E family transporter [Ginsengibacter sp.]
MEKKYPFYFRSTVTLFGIMLFIYLLYVLKAILIPLAFAAMIAILLNPFVNRLRQKKIPNILAILIALLTTILLVAGVMVFISSQIVKFSDNMPVLQEKFSILFHHFQLWLQQNYSLTLQKQQELLAQAGSNLKPLIGQTLGTVLGIVSVIVLLPIYIFLLLFYKTLILNFLFEIFAEQNSTQVATVLKETKGAIQSYMVGLLLEALIVAAMNSAALMLLGVKYAILIGVIGAILNILPYIGGLVAIAIPLLIATVTKDGFTTQIGIIIAYLVIQFIDNNILVPRIVSSKVKINALVSIVIVLLGAAIWGVAGMFLSIPFIAVLKIIFDRVKELKPWGKLLGDDVPVLHKGQLWGFRSKRRKSLVEKVATDN